MYLFNLLYCWKVNCTPVINQTVIDFKTYKKYQIYLLFNFLHFGQGHKCYYLCLCFGVVKRNHMKQFWNRHNVYIIRLVNKLATWSISLQMQNDSIPPRNWYIEVEEYCCCEYFLMQVTKSIDILFIFLYLSLLKLVAMN